MDVRLESPELCSLASDNEDEPVLNEELAKLVMPNKDFLSLINPQKRRKFSENES